MTAAATSDIAALIEALGLMPLVGEGGWWAPGPRTRDLNAITYLMTDADDGFSALHRLEVMEGWQWLDGSPAHTLRLHPDGSSEHSTLDANRRQLIVPAGTWQGARTTGAWTLVSCWCTPAFTDDTFELGDRAMLQAAYPADRRDIALLTREPS